MTATVNIYQSSLKPKKKKFWKRLRQEMGPVGRTNVSTGFMRLLSSWRLAIRVFKGAPEGTGVWVQVKEGCQTSTPPFPADIDGFCVLASLQIQLDLDKYLPRVGSPLLSLPVDKKYRRESASVVDEYFSEEKPSTPYSLNINLILPSTTHLRTGLYRPNKSLPPQQIKTEPDLEVPCSISTPGSTQALPDFTSVFNVHPVTSSVFIKPDLSAEGGMANGPSGSQQNLNSELQIGPPAPQQHVYHMPVTGGSDLTMTLSHNSLQALGSAGSRALLSLGGATLPMASGPYMMVEQHLPQQQQGYYQASHAASTAPHSLPPSPPNSQPASPDGQAELLSLASQQPPPYQQRLVKMAGLTPHALLMTHGQGVLTGPKYNRRNNPELEKRRIHFCDYPGDHMTQRVLSFTSTGSTTAAA